MLIIRQKPTYTFGGTWFASIELQRHSLLIGAELPSAGSGAYATGMWRLKKEPTPECSWRRVPDTSRTYTIHSSPRSFRLHLLFITIEIGWPNLRVEPEQRDPDYDQFDWFSQ